MKLKKFCALIMALAMTLALTVPAMANNSLGTRTFNINGTGKAGVIDVAMETPTNIILNPYQMKATVNSGDSVGSYHQIHFVPVKCTNKSDFGLKVNAVIKGTASSGVEFVSAAPKDTATEKQVFLYAEFGTSSTLQQPAWASGYDKSNASQVLISSDDSASKTVATLTAATSEKPNYLWYKFDGAATKSPTNSWTGSDSVGANVVLTFVPTVDAVYPITVVNTTSKTAAGTVALNYDLAPAGTEIIVTCSPDDDLGGTPTVTAAQGTTKITVTDNESFTMPAGDVTVTVKWTAAS